MADTTPKGFRYPEDSDAPNIAVDIENLATDVDNGLDDYIAKSIVTAAGDLITASGSATPTRLAIGTAGQVLTVNSGATAPEWVSGGSLIEISNGSLSGASVNITSIPTTYQKIILYLNNIYPATDNAQPIVRINSESSNYRIIGLINTNASISTVGATTTNNLIKADSPDNTSNNAIMILEFPNYSSTTTRKLCFAQAAYLGDNGTNQSTYFGISQNTTTSAITSIQISYASGDIGGGNYFLYGVK